MHFRDVPRRRGRAVIRGRNPGGSAPDRPLPAPRLALRLFPSARPVPSGSGSPVGVGGPAGSRRGDPGSGAGPGRRPARCPAGGGSSRVRPFVAYGKERSNAWPWRGPKSPSVRPFCLGQEKVERVGSGGDRADPGARANHPPHPPAPALLGMGGKCEGAGPRRPAAPSRRRSADPAQIRSRSTLSPTPGSVAQRLERTTHNREVPGSNPGGATEARAKSWLRSATGGLLW